MGVSETTKIANLINPEVMADMISAKVEKKIVVAPFARIDTTLQGVPGNTITVPQYSYIGDAVDISEGIAADTVKLETGSTTATVKKAMKAVELTDEAVLSGYGDPVAETNNQLAKAIASKVDNDAMDALQGAQLTYAGTAGIITYDGIVDAIDKFDEEINTDKVIFVNPKQVTQLRKDNDFISADKYKAGVALTGEIGMIANCRVVPSKKVVKIDAVTAVAGVYTVTIGGTVATGDKITIAGVETTLDETSAASATTAATAIATAFGTNTTYTVTRSGAVLTFTEKAGKEGTAVPAVAIVSDAGTAVRVTTTPGVAAAVAQYHCPIVKLNNDDETEEDAPALTVYLKRDTNVEAERVSLARKTDISVDKHYTVALSNTSKVVLAKFAAVAAS